MVYTDSKGVGTVYLRLKFTEFLCYTSMSKAFIKNKTVNEKMFKIQHIYL